MPSAAEITAIGVALATLVSSIAGLIVAIRSNGKLAETHALVNGATQQLSALATAAGHATGVKEGMALERDRPPS
jgi:hypothetical protein